MGGGRVTDLHEAWRYTHLQGFSTEDLSGGGTFGICWIYVPFDHILRKASFAGEDFANGDTDTIELRRQTIGAGASSVVKAGTWGDSGNNAARIDLDPTTEVEIRGGALYFISIVADAADQVLEQCLSIMVSPVPPGPA